MYHLILSLQIPDVYVRGNAIATVHFGPNSVDAFHHRQVENVDDDKGNETENQSAAQTEASDTLRSDVNSDNNIQEGAKDCGGCEQEVFAVDANDAYGVELPGISVREYENVLEDL